MSGCARLMGSAVPLAVSIPSTLPPGPTTGPPTLPGRSSACSRNWVSVVLLTNAEVGREVFDPRVRQQDDWVVTKQDGRITQRHRSSLRGYPHLGDPQGGVDAHQVNRMHAAAVVHQPETLAAADQARRREEIALRIDQKCGPEGVAVDDRHHALEGSIELVR